MSNTPRQIAETFVTQGIAKADMAVFDALIAPDVVVETGLSPQGPILGREAYKAVFAGFAEAWPVRDFQIHRIDEAGATIFIEFTATCVFLKDYYGVPATRHVAPLRELHRLEVTNGLITRNTVGAINLPFEFLMYPALKDAVLGGLAIEA